MAKGYSASGDILTRTRDGQDLNAIWAQYATLLDSFNTARQPLIDLLSFTTTQMTEDVVQPGQETFEKATEFGIPMSIRPMPTPVARAYPFDWYDTRAAYTFQFLAGGPQQSDGASSQQLDAVMNQVLEADNRLQFELVMKALFNSANRTTVIDGVTFNVTALWNNDGLFTPPPYRGTTFASSHNHYIGSGANAGQTKFDPGDHLALANLVEEHGYTRSNGYNVIFLMNPVDAQAGIQNFVRGVSFVSGGASPVTSLYDFIPSQGLNLALQLPPGYTLAGGVPDNSFAGLDVIGSWGPYLVIQDAQIPVGYMAAVATRGNGTTTNVVGLREHANPALRGLVLKPGNNNNYPLIDSMFVRGLGSAIGPRGAAALMKLDNSGGAYTVPTAYAW
jgi:hypothetical protein